MKSNTQLQAEIAYLKKELIEQNKDNSIAIKRLEAEKEIIKSEYNEYINVTCKEKNSYVDALIDIEYTTIWDRIFHWNRKYNEILKQYRIKIY